MNHFSGPVLCKTTKPPTHHSDDLQCSFNNWAETQGNRTLAQHCGRRNWNYRAEGLRSWLWFAGATSPWAGENVGAVLLPLKLYLPLILAFQFPHTAQTPPPPPSSPPPFPFVSLIRTGPAISSAFLWEVVGLFVNTDRSGEWQHSFSVHRWAVSGISSLKADGCRHLCRTGVSHY